MIWCRFQKDKLVSYGIVEGDTVIAVEGDPFSDYRKTPGRGSNTRASWWR
jgi:hypothetical protein